MEESILKNTLQIARDLLLGIPLPPTRSATKPPPPPPRTTPTTTTPAPTTPTPTIRSATGPTGVRWTINTTDDKKSGFERTIYLDSSGNLINQV